MSKADGQDEAADDDDAQKGSTFAGRLTETGKWAVGILGAAGTFAVGNFLFSELGKRPVDFDGDLDPFDWPGGEGWSFIGAIVFGLGLVLAIASILAIRRADRVSMAYLTGRAYPFTVRRYVRSAIRRSSYLTQVPVAGYGLIDEAANRLAAIYEGSHLPLERAATAAANQAAASWLTLLEEPEAELDESAWAAVAEVSGQDVSTRLRMQWQTDREAAMSRVRSALRATRIEARLQQMLGRAMVYGMTEEFRRALRNLAVNDTKVDRLAEAVNSVADEVDDVADGLGRALCIDTRSSPVTIADTVRIIARKHFRLGRSSVAPTLLPELRSTFQTNLIELEHLPSMYARAIRRGDRVQAAHFLGVVKTVLQTARHERVQVIASRNAVALPLAAVLIPLGASLFVFHINAATQLREDQQTARAERRADELRAAEESVEGDLIASMPAIAALRLPADLPEDDPWATALDASCRLVDVEADQQQPRSIPVVLLKLAAPPVADDAAIIAGGGVPDRDAVARVVTSRTAECPHSVEGWVLPDWVVSPDLPQSQVSELEKDPDTTSPSTTVSPATTVPPTTD